MKLFFLICIIIFVGCNRQDPHRIRFTNRCPWNIEEAINHLEHCKKRADEGNDTEENHIRWIEQCDFLDKSIFGPCELPDNEKKNHTILITTKQQVLEKYCHELD